MIIRRLILENYGLFGGRHELDLAPRVQRGERRPIVLFGGKNGAGKSTLLEAIRLVLYGRLSLGDRVRSSDYDAFLRGRVHRGKADADRPTVATLAIEFDHVHRGTSDRYFVERSWQTSGGAVAERLTVRRDDKRLDDVDAEFWQGFVRDIIPDGLSQLFFFDGEKIRELAEDATGSSALAGSIKSLLGLDLVERLDADLTVYANREAAKLGSDDERIQAETLDAAIEADRRVILEEEEALAENRTRHDGVQGELRRAEEDLRSEGEGLADRRARLKADAEQLKARVEAAERGLREQCEGLFPLSLCPATAGRLLQQLQAERDAAHAERVTEVLGRTRKGLVTALKKRRGKDAADAGLLAIVDAVFARNAIAPVAAAAAGPVHDLSDAEHHRLGAWLGEASERSRAGVNGLCREVTSSRRRLEAIERSLARLPSEGSALPRLQVLSDLGRRLGALEQERVTTESRLKGLRFQFEAKSRERRKLAERHEGAAGSGRRIVLARSVQGALAAYLRRLTELKVAQLRETVAECFNRLCRKGDVVRRIEIDPTTFGVKLFDAADRSVPKEELSSGEKQIFAIALLWGLARTSGRPLPVIIDTPLGRLDSEHRRNLIEQYFPHASHQVILLSTDTEVDQTLFEQLAPSISHSYQLQYQEAAAHTSVVNDYFWRRPALV